MYVKAIYCHCKVLLVWGTWWCVELLYEMWPFPTLYVSPPEEGEYFLKVLIPSYAAGSIIGKGGQTIVQLQKETGATIKLSKSKDFYPGKNGHSAITIDEYKAYIGIWKELYSAEGVMLWCKRAFDKSSSFDFPWVIAVHFNHAPIVNTWLSVRPWRTLHVDVTDLRCSIQVWRQFQLQLSCRIFFLIVHYMNYLHCWEKLKCHVISPQKWARILWRRGHTAYIESMNCPGESHAKMARGEGCSRSSVTLITWRSKLNHPPNANA